MSANIHKPGALTKLENADYIAPDALVRAYLDRIGPASLMDKAFLADPRLLLS